MANLIICRWCKKNGSILCRGVSWPRSIYGIMAAKNIFRAGKKRLKKDRLIAKFFHHLFIFTVCWQDNSCHIAPTFLWSSCLPRQASKVCFSEDWKLRRSITTFQLQILLENLLVLLSWCSSIKTNAALLKHETRAGQKWLLANFLFWWWRKQLSSIKLLLWKHQAKDHFQLLFADAQPTI